MLKRLVDVVVAVLALIVLGPVLSCLAFLVRLKLGSPVLFRQDRVGLGGRPFVLFKFRSMTDQHSADGELLADELRLGPFGAWLRETSLDELPELWNVVRGEMSLVGPRPLPVAYLPRFSQVEARRHTVRPGITGWAQVSGRNSLDWSERLAADIWYVDNRSLRLDLAILARTIRSVVRREGVAAPGQATMHELPHFKDRTP